MCIRLAKTFAAALLVTAFSVSPAWAQAANQPQGKPVGQYMLLAVLLAIPIGLVCRSSRR